MKFNIYIFMLLLAILCLSCNKNVFEGYEIKTHKKLIHRNWTTMQCQNYCENRYGNNCLYANVEKRDGKRGNCYISGGYDKQKIGYGGIGKTLWANKKGKTIKTLTAKDYGQDAARKGWKQQKQHYKTRNSGCTGWAWWRRCWSARYAYRWVDVRRAAKTNFKMGEGGCIKPGVTGMEKTRSKHDICPKPTQCISTRRRLYPSYATIPNHIAGLTGLSKKNKSYTWGFCAYPDGKKYLL
jgi:hypothetical protein